MAQISRRIGKMIIYLRTFIFLVLTPRLMDPQKNTSTTNKHNYLPEPLIQPHACINSQCDSSSILYRATSIDIF